VTGTSAAPVRRRDRAATESALIAAATAVFAEKGYENATTHAIAEVAGCSEALIQRYFDGKEGLLLAVLREDKADPKRAGFLERPLCSSLRKEAKEAILYSIDMMAERSERMRIVFSRVLVDRGFQAEFDRIFARGRIRNGLTARLVRYVEAGMIDPAIDIDAATELLLTFNLQLGFVHREILRTKPVKLRQLADDFAAFFEHALKTQIRSTS
jgi:AcrR family transcriptional regulator